MQTTNNAGEIAIAVCPKCNMHSVCDPSWLSIEGQTLNIDCDNCVVEQSRIPHLIMKFIKATQKDTEKLAESADSGLLQPRLVRLSKMWAVYAKYDDLTEWRVFSAEPDEDEAKRTAAYLKTTHPEYGVQIIPPNAEPIHGVKDA